MGALVGLTALVTGGGRGIGKAVCLAFAREGARVAAAARTVAEIEAVAAETGGLALPLDVTDEAACRGAVERVEREWGGLDVLVNNAGISGGRKFAEIDAATWRRTLAVDLDGAYLMIRAALPGMLQRKRGAVIQVASVAGRVGVPYAADYVAAKHGLIGLSRALAAEFPRSGVTFNCVCPAFVDTPMTQRTVANIVGRTGRTPADAEKALHTPQGRLVQPEEVAVVCVLLASPAGRGINGQALNVDGGQVQS
ncbi:MAG TPA: SDR family NAD(P)-dependent oxidoreductase [Candidatus Acidoferrales bacterium]|nr:SDR family NAD(P)-dependent oxidoreductase [Candidatus Acidoferrales bacterium]